MSVEIPLQYFKVIILLENLMKPLNYLIKEIITDV